MNLKKIVDLTNRVAYFSVALLAYWVFVFVVITVFDLKVFRENITQAFYMSILGIFALLGGAIILNIMLNMTRISGCMEAKESSNTATHGTKKRNIVLAIGIFPVIVALLFLGDYASSLKKKEHLVGAAEYLASENKESIKLLINYEFEETYIEKTADVLKILTQVEKKFPDIRVVVQDSVGDNNVFLFFGKWHNSKDEKIFKKEDYIFPASQEDREYLKRVFSSSYSEIKFSAHDGKYELYFPIREHGRVIVLYLTDRQRYGKLGS
ncbi:hypothetical protein MNBD_GAMMA26-1167 [hydrothermal vent metagenome]|uniref:Uncharacterized protein n=1 Tax=hydrothermal vent metagenome TaxID=652676 RepID=A0A3B1BCI6_9ZZZZ